MDNPIYGDEPLVYLITKGNLTAGNFATESNRTLDIIRQAVESKINLIQIREKQLPADLVFKLVSKSLEYSKGYSSKILVNDRFDIALAANAHGAHLTSQSIPTRVVRRSVPKDFNLGVSTHSVLEAQNARDEGANFVTFSPIFPTNSKAVFGNPQGLARLRDVCKKLDGFPVVALGGINAENFESALDRGAAGFAGISFLNDVSNIRLFSDEE